MRLSPIPSSSPIVGQGGIMTQVMRNFMNAVARSSIIEGSGSPEGVIEARTTRMYMDTAGSSGSVLYVKQVDAVAGDRKRGWVLV